MLLVPCAVGALPRAAVRRPAHRPPARARHQPPWSVRELLAHLLRQPAPQPGLRLGVRQPVPAGHRLRLPRHLPGLLPARAPRHQRGRRPAPDLPRHRVPVRGPGRAPPWSPASCPTTPDVARRSCAPPPSSTGRRCSSSRAPATSTATWSGWPSAVSGSACTWPSTLPSWSTYSPTRPGRQGPRRPQHRGRPPVLPRPSHRPRSPGLGGDSYRVLFGVAGACAVAGAAAILPVKGVR